MLHHYSELLLKRAQLPTYHSAAPHAHVESTPIPIPLSLRAVASNLDACGAPVDQQKGDRRSGGFHTAVGASRRSHLGPSRILGQPSNSSTHPSAGGWFVWRFRQIQEILLKSHQ